MMQASRIEAEPTAALAGEGADVLGDSAWAAIQAGLRRDCGQRTFDSWLKPLRLVECDLDGGSVTLGAATAFMAAQIESHYGERLHLAWRQALPQVRVVRVVAHSGAPTLYVAAEQASPAESGAAAEAEPLITPGVCGGTPLEPRYTFEAFVVGKPNEVAYNAARTMAEGGAVAFNPLFFHGATGLGKTHLMHAIGHETLRRDPNARVLYMSAEKFMFEFISALRNKDTFSFKQRLRSVDLLMIDDVQFIAGKDSTQEEFFHTMNELISAGKRIVITADRSPQDLQGVESRILSRLAWGLVADLNPADFELRLNIIEKKLEAVPQAEVPADVRLFLAKRISANVRELEGALNRVVAYAALAGRRVDIDFVQETLADLLRASQRRVSIEEIQRTVADHYRIRLAEMTSARRAREVARPRQVAMYLSKQLTPRSLPEIGRRFGGRDHTTVIHAVKQIEKLRQADAELDSDLRLLSRQIEG